MSGATTAIMIGFTALSALGSIKQAGAEAKSTIAEGNLVSKNKAQEVAMKAARQTSSFLNSGLTLEGTPMSVIDSTFSTGLEDIRQINSNYNTKSKNIISAGRTEALGKIASGFSGMSTPSSLSFSGIQGSVGNSFNPAYFGDLSNASNMDRYLGATQGL